MDGVIVIQDTPISNNRQNKMGNKYCGSRHGLGIIHDIVYKPLPTCVLCFLSESGLRPVVHNLSSVLFLTVPVRYILYTLK